MASFFTYVASMKKFLIGIYLPSPGSLTLYRKSCRKNKILSVVYNLYSAFAFTADNNIKDRHARVRGHPVGMFKLSVFILPLSPV